VLTSAGGGGRVRVMDRPERPSKGGGGGGDDEDPALAKKHLFAMQWECHEKLGSGQFADVFRATEKRPKDRFNPRIVAVKLMEKSKLTAEDKAALSVEVESMKRLSDHDAFVKLYEFFDEADKYMLVIELISGGELFDRIVEKEKYTEREARRVIRQLTEAMAYAHKKGIAHRDLKPENVLLRDKNDDTSIKIADFGFAKIISEGELMKTPCGTPGYVAPEILSGKPYGLQADMWSLGVIFFILLSGYPPFADDDQKRLFEQIKAANYNFNDPVWDSISAGAKDLVSKTLVADPDVRLSAAGILAHPWLTADDAVIPDEILSGTKEQLARFQARRRLKKAIVGIRSTIRMRMMMKASAAAARSGEDK